jgi:hypothetical protein
MKNSLFSILILFLVVNSWAQTRISGIVVDSEGKPVPFANVVFVNSSEGTTTNEKGYFYLKSSEDQESAEFSFLGYKKKIIPLNPGDNLNMKVVMEEAEESLSEVFLFRGKTSKKNNPAIDILRKIWENRRQNGVKKFDQYAFRKYEKLEFDLNTIDSSIINSSAFNGIEFIFDNLDTNALTGKSYLPLFLNESLQQVYGDNTTGKTREDLLGNKNSGFNENQILIASLKDLYYELDIYDNYLRIFDKNFISPLSTTGIDTYNYVLKDSSYIGDKWCYNIVYYPRRENELTFKGNFWVNDTTWAIRKINLEMAEDANINWVNNVFIEQEYKVLNDSVFLLTRDFFMADFALQKKKDARGIYGKKTVLYDNYQFDKKREDAFYNRRVTEYQESVYNREEEFWVQNRLEPLSRNESGIYKMLDTLQTVKSFQRIYTLANIAATGYIEFNGWDFGPLYSVLGFNEVEGWRVRAGARTYFGQNDPWRIEGYTAFGFRDKRIKYGILGKVMLDSRSRLIISAGHRFDIEQLGASLTNSTDVLGRSLASSSLINVGDNDKLSSIGLSTFALDIEPVHNFNIRFSGSHLKLQPASPAFSLSWYKNEEQTEIATLINQTEVTTALSFFPGRKTTGYGVDRNVVNAENFPTFFVNYTLGVKDILKSDFNYKKVQLYYNQPLWIGGLGLANTSIEAGKTFGAVPLGLLSVIPGNQTYFALYNTFPLLNFYEFVTDTYVTAHFEHNFNGKLFSYVPGLRDLNLREIIGIRGAWGEISEENKQLDASGLLLIAPNVEPYYEYSVGVGNIFRFLRVDAHFRGNYFDNPDARTFGVTAALGFHF